MKFVPMYGYVFRLSDAAYQKMLKAVAAGEDFSLEELGNEIGQLSPSPLDMQPEAAIDLLEKEEGK